MSDRDNIPVLTDLIEKGGEITLSDLGLDEHYEGDIDLGPVDDDDTEIEITAPDPDADAPLAADTMTDDPMAEDPVERAIHAEADEWLEQHPALEQAIRRILDEHTELALQEIKLAIQRELNK